MCQKLKDWSVRDGGATGVFVFTLYIYTRTIHEYIYVHSRYSIIFETIPVQELAHVLASYLVGRVCHTVSQYTRNGNPQQLYRMRKPHTQLLHIFGRKTHSRLSHREISLCEFCRYLCGKTLRTTAGWRVTQLPETITC